jgi:hypothetical protein
LHIGNLKLYIAELANWGIYGAHMFGGKSMAEDIETDEKLYPAGQSADEMRRCYILEKLSQGLSIEPGDLVKTCAGLDNWLKTGNAPSTAEIKQIKTSSK